MIRFYLKNKRESLGISQTELAKRLREKYPFLKVSQVALSNFEKGNRDISRLLFFALCVELGFTADEILKNVKEELNG